MLNERLSRMRKKLAEYIGPIHIKLAEGVTVSIMPLLYTMVLGLTFYLAKSVTWIKRKQARIAEGAMMLFIGVLIAKLAVASGQSIHLLFEMGPALLLQELGHPLHSNFSCSSLLSD